MTVHTSIQSAQKNLQSSTEKFTPEALQEAFQPIMGNVKAWGELMQQQAQVSQSLVTQTFEAFRNAKEPQAAFEVMSTFVQNLVALNSKNIKDTVALSVAQFKGNVDSLEKNLPASEAVASLANLMKDSASKIESTVESSVDEGDVVIKKARAA